MFNRKDNHCLVSKVLPGSDFGHAETGSGAKKLVVLRVNFFHSNFKVEWENGVWTKIRFLACFLFVHMRHFDIDFQFLELRKLCGIERK